MWLPTPSQHFMFSALALLGYVLSTRARREWRAPAAAIAWVMGLALLPYLMLPLYIIFGQRKLKASPSPRATHVNANSHWAAALLSSFGLAPPIPTQVRFHADGAHAREALWEIIDGARERLDVCTFLIGGDDFGREAVERLACRARTGVQVRLLLDGVGAWFAPRHALQAFKAAGGQVAVFRPLFGSRRLGPRNLRNHRKFTIADNSRVWAGGRNLATEYFTGDDGIEPWIDLSFDLTGTIAAVVARQFEADWAAAQGPQPRGVPATLPADTGALAQFLPSGPDQSEDTAQSLLVDACFRAQHRLIAVTPYFVPDDSLHTALRLAARRGVQVTLVLPVKSNHRLADFVRSRSLRDLAEAGAEIRALPRMVHAKAVVVDDTLAMCGSINLDLRSLLLNYESAVLFYGPDEIGWLAQWLEALVSQSQPFIPKAPGLLRDVGEGLLLAIAFQL